MQNAAANLAVPLSASLLGAFAVLVLIALLLVLYARRVRRRRSAAAAARKSAGTLPVTVEARAPGQVKP
jgi:hypothetical protein